MLSDISQLPLQVGWDHATISDQWTKSERDMSPFQVQAVNSPPSVLDWMEENLAHQSKDLCEPNLNFYAALKPPRNLGLFDITAQVSWNNTDGQNYLMRSDVIIQRCNQEGSETKILVDPGTQSS